MNKIEPNMYVRTLFGIKKIDHINNKKTVWKYLYKINDDNEFYALSDNDVIKASYNIIDLIEKGDFVKVRIDGIFINYFMVDKFEDEDENIRLGIGCYEDGLLDTISEYRPLETLEILGIVTKEQFSSMEYRLGE